MGAVTKLNDRSAGCRKFLRGTALGAALAAWVLGMSGCVSAGPEERRSRDAVTEVGRKLTEESQGRVARLLAGELGLVQATEVAVLTHPSVRASYEDWRASVAMVAPARSLSDPQLTFEADVARTLMTFMPGVMVDLMGSAKRQRMADEASAESRVAYRAYVSQLLSVASQVRMAWLDLAMAEESLGITRASQASVREAAQIAASDYATGRGMMSLDPSVTWANEADRLASEEKVLEAGVLAARSAFKSALGLEPADPDPKWPHPVLERGALPPEPQLWAQIEANNADLAQLRAMVDVAVASVAVAREARTPDVSLGAMVDFKANPLLVRPLATMSLPLWREKIDALVGASRGREAAAGDRVRAETLALAATMAQLLSTVRQADERIAFIDERALPATERSIATAQVGYQTGSGNLIMIPQAHLMASGLRLDRTRALWERERAASGLLLLASVPTPEVSALLEPQGSTSP